MVPIFKMIPDSQIFPTKERLTKCAPILCFSLPLYACFAETIPDAQQKGNKKYFQQATRQPFLVEDIKIKYEHTELLILYPIHEAKITQMLF